MSTNRIAEIGRQLLDVASRSKADAERLGNQYNGQHFRCAAVALFLEAIKLGAIDAPEHGYLKGVLASNTENRPDDWQFFFFIAGVTIISGNNSPNWQNPTDGIKAMGEFLISIAPDKPAGDTGGDAMDKQSRALALLISKPEWTDIQIAEAVGCNRTTLYDWPKFKAARKSQYQGKTPPALTAQKSRRTARDKFSKEKPD